MGILSAFSWTVVKVFFSSAEVVQAENVPLDKPLLLVINHNNQFIDAAVTVHSLPRNVSFIVAESSMHICIIGDCARLANSVPVVRPQDRAVAGAGSLVEVDLESLVLTGRGTRFTKEEILKKGSKIDCKGVFTFTVQEVVSDTTVKFKVSDEEEMEELKAAIGKFTVDTPVNYKMLPYVDQNEVYRAVHERLENNAAIAIFPEGGSHDRPNMLPLKAGVAVMALGAIDAGVKDLMILPIGLNYFNASAFRSNVLVEVGEPFSVPDDVFARYKEGDRRGAYQDVMELVKEGMQNVTLNAPDYKTQKIMRTARRLYQNGAELDAHQYLELYRRFLNGYEKWKDNEDFQKLIADIGNYLTLLDTLGLHDKTIEKMPPSNSCTTVLEALFEIFLSIFIMTVLMIVALPGIILNFPLYLVITYKVNAEVKKALAKSKVKIKALDVAASQKLINTMKFLPLMYLLNAVALLILLFFLYDQKHKDDDQSYFLDNIFWILPIILFVVLPAYTYFMVIVVESASKRGGLLKPRFYTIWKAYSRSAPACLGGRSQLSPATDVRLRRRELVIRTQDIIRDLTGDDEDWVNDPIISEEMMRNGRNVLTAKVIKMAQRKPTDTSLLSKIGDQEIDKFLGLSDKQKDALL